MSGIVKLVLIAALLAGLYIVFQRYIAPEVTGPFRGGVNFQGKPSGNLSQ